jgi:hypothetical protein
MNHTATNIAGGVKGNIPIQADTSVTTFIANGTNGQLLQSGGDSASWVTTGTIKVGYAVYSDNEYINNLTQATTPALRYPTMAVGPNSYASLGVAAELSYDLAQKILTVGGITATNTTTSTSVQTGALVVAGGAGFAGDVWIGGTLNVPYVGTATNLRNGTAGQVPYQTTASQTSFFGPGTAGEVLVSNGTLGPRYQNTLTLTSINSATSTQTGALIVAGGVGVGGNLYVGGEIVAQKLTIEYTTVTTTLVQTDDVIKTYNDTAAISTETGALIVTGGAGIGGDLWVGGTIHTIQSVGRATNLDGGNVGELVFQSATSSTSFVNAGTTGQILVSRGSNIAGPVFTNTASIRVGYADTATYALNVASASSASIANLATSIAGGTTGQILFQSTSSSTSFAGPGTVGQILISQGTSTFGPIFVNTASIRVGYADTATYTINAGTATIAATATNITGGTTNQIPYQTTASQTSFFGPGTGGDVLVSNGTQAGGPAFQNTLTLASVTSATSTQTGAFQVRGGAGIGGDLFVGGNIYGLQEITAYYGAPSDIRLKTNVEVIDQGLAKVVSLDGVTYNWNEQAIGKDTAVREVGVIAQQLQKVLPEAVVEKDDGTLTVKYERIIPLLIEAIKELSNEVEDLKKKIK